jgi:hypothetical protein
MVQERMIDASGTDERVPVLFEIEKRLIIGNRLDTHFGRGRNRCGIHGGCIANCL